MKLGKKSIQSGGQDAKKAPRRLKKGKKHVEPEMETEGLDEVITSDTDVDNLDEPAAPQPERKAAKPVPAFTGGFVHSSLTGAVNMQWGRTEETAAFMNAVKTTHVVNGVFVGDIEVRPSFVKRSKGSVLL